MEDYRGWWLVVVLLASAVLTSARPQELDDEDYGRHSGEQNADDVARVQIKVYRGPTKHDGYAPWGYWVKQPSDD